jgi:hypothetical protein
MKNISFEISGIMLEGKAKAMHANKQGFFEDVPLLVLGKPSRNGKVYTVESMTKALTDPSSYFVKHLRSSALYGQYGHPMVKSEADLADIANIDMKLVSHQIGKVYTKEAATEQGNQVVYGWIKPFGPYGKYLKDSFEDETQNTCFSLRSLVERVGSDANGNIIQTVTCLVTIDAVPLGGYAQAAKVYDPSVESITIPIKKQETVNQMVSQELLDDHQLQDILGADKLYTTHANFDIVHGRMERDGRQVDPFHIFFK